MAIKNKTHGYILQNNATATNTASETPGLSGGTWLYHLDNNAGGTFSVDLWFKPSSHTKWKKVNTSALTADTVLSIEVSAGTQYRDQINSITGGATIYSSISKVSS